MLFLWTAGIHNWRVPGGKRERGIPHGLGTPWKTVGLSGIVSEHVVVAAIWTSAAAVIKGHLGNKAVDMMLDSGSSISLIHESAVPDLSGVSQFVSGEPQIVSAAGEPIPVMGHVCLPVNIEQLQVDHSLVVVHLLIAPVILGVDFLKKHCLRM